MADPDQSGLFPDHAIAALFEHGAAFSQSALAEDQIQPASLDLRLGDKAWRVRASFLPGQNNSVADRLADFTMHEVSLTEGAVLEKGCVYVVPLQEGLRLPACVDAVANAKSSTGRLDILTRVITDQGTEFDRIAPGYHGPLYAEICPRSFSVLVRPGMRLNQIRFRQGRALLSDAELSALHEAETLVSGGPVIVQDGLGFSVDLSPGKDRLVGWRAKPHSGVIDLARIGAYPVNAFWDALHTENGRLVLDPGAFYILVSREAVSIPPAYAAEMVPYLAMVGEFRVHYAGFFDPGFGHTEAGGAGARGVLEVRCHEVPFVLEHGQTVGRLAFERLQSSPAKLYGREIKSNYQGQGLKLAKQFQTP